MDPATIIVGCVTGLLSVGAAVIFVRQEQRIKVLEGRDAEHVKCREELAALRVRVQELERLLGKEDAA